MTVRLNVTAPLRVGSAPFSETQAGHRCNTCRSHGKAGVDCAHGHVILSAETAVARLRADRAHEGQDGA
jgi:hypothetical protein